ncbi:hypothetical protein KVR01_012846 [Diaporthe batatas]|uniref:uncharacterized protein n=1 Tax=Diaporthe batatas TaxID=748121 RepID=UPI001D0468B8|nr:uncharacterized protein KVR01_012846 [Diaporthe batatas]KAG8157462.1 hypothetical protein KVR01_012846 [Diaporthe batatas]
MNRIMVAVGVGAVSFVVVVYTHMSQPQSTILPMALISVIACFNMSSSTKNEGLVEEDPIVMEDRGLVRQHRLPAQALRACVNALRSYPAPISYVSLLYLCFYALEGQEDMSTIEQIIVLQICTGGAVLARFLVNMAMLGLSVQLVNTFVVRPKLRSAAPGEYPSEAGTGNTGSCYPDCPLTAPDSIRVIRLHPGSPGDKLQCTLAAVKLEENPTYEALSYCWGRRASNNHIECHSSSSPAATNDGLAPAAALAITDTLHDALVYLRHTKDERVLWVDQICINQKDNEERSAQVKLMQKIYSSTRCAIVWLRVGLPALPESLVAQRSELPGLYQRIEKTIAKLAEDDGLESDPVFGPKVRSKRPLRNMTKAELVRYGLPSENGGRWSLFYGLFDSPWFSRVWVVQEVAWPREVKVHYTNMETSWEQFTRVMAFVESLEIEIFDPRRRAVCHFFSRLRALQACRMNIRAGSPKPLDQVLSQHRVAAATDPRDHIYGLMGLASEQPPPLEPDYGASASSVFLEATRWAVRDGCLDILGLGGDPSSPDRPKGLPSWAPDFSDANGPHSLTGMGMLPHFEVSSLKQFRAGGGPVAAPRIRDDGVMEITGQLIGRVREVTAGVAPGRDMLDAYRMRATAQIESNTLHVSSIVRDGLRMLNTKMEWQKMAGELIARSSGHYTHTGESMGDAVMRTCLLGETHETIEKMRPLYENDQLQLRVWRLLTLGRGCSRLLLGYAIMAVAFIGPLAAEPLLRRCGYRYIMRNWEYHARRQISAERELFCGTNGLVGLAPRWSALGDEIFVLRGGKVPVLLRRDGDSGPYQFVGEAYVHGAMEGDMFDLHKCENLLIA